MESRTTNNLINAIKEVRELFNELRSNLSRKENSCKFEKNFTKKKLFIIF